MKLMAPEIVALGPVQIWEGLTSDQPPSGSKVDVWALGMVLLQTLIVSYFKMFYS